jgi:hypothetical protein
MPRTFIPEKRLPKHLVTRLVGMLTYFASADCFTNLFRPEISAESALPRPRCINFSAHNYFQPVKPNNKTPKMTKLKINCIANVRPQISTKPKQ